MLKRVMLNWESTIRSRSSEPLFSNSSSSWATSSRLSGTTRYSGRFSFRAWWISFTTSTSETVLPT